MEVSPFVILFLTPIVPMTLFAGSFFLFTFVQHGSESWRDAVFSMSKDGFLRWSMRALVWIGCAWIAVLFIVRQWPELLIPAFGWWHHD